jgi:unsaturated chondroitin disaccharide hydrolase
MTMTRAVHFGWIVVGGLCALAGSAHAFDEEKADHALQFAQEQVRRTASRPDIPSSLYPKTSTDEGNCSPDPVVTREAEA